MKKNLLLLCLTLAFVSCQSAKKVKGDDGKIEIVILQINDVYEISPLSDQSGGLARVAALRKELKAKNPNTFTLLAGDFISPSVMGTLRYEGKRIRGKHMIETLNALGVDAAVFGNHEFDYDDIKDLQARLDESDFPWLAANARYQTESGLTPFYRNRPEGKIPCPDQMILSARDADGTSAQIGVFGVLIDSGRKPYVKYSDAFEAAKKSRETLRPQTDFCIGLTHLAIENDKKLAGMLPDLPLIVGGHEHDNQIHKVGNVTIAKADANARTVYVHTIVWDKKTKTAAVRSELKKISPSIKDDPATAAVVAKWEKIKNESLSSSGFDAAAVVTTLSKPLDCREAVVRNAPVPVGEMINGAIQAAAQNKPECTFFNSGSIRVDDVLSGTLTEFDVIRMLPFGGAIVEAEMKGDLLRRTFEAGLGNKGNGGFLQLNGVRRDDASGKWMIGSAPLDDAKTYRAAMPEFLLTGNESNMAFLKTEASADGKGTTNPGVVRLYKPSPNDKADLRNDIRLALIRYLRAKQ